MKHDFERWMKAELIKIGNSYLHFRFDMQGFVLKDSYYYMTDGRLDENLLKVNRSRSTKMAFENNVFFKTLGWDLDKTDHAIENLRNAYNYMIEFFTKRFESKAGLEIMEKQQYTEKKLIACESHNTGKCTALP